jgi:hypothetical protein
LGVINKIKQVMAFNATHDKESNAQETVNKQEQNDPNQLNAKEIVFLLEVLKKSQFVGEQVEIVYGSILKLQNQYIKITK